MLSYFIKIVAKPVLMNKFWVDYFKKCIPHYTLAYAPSQTPMDRAFARVRVSAYEEWITPPTPSKLKLASD